MARSNLIKIDSKLFKPIQEIAKKENTTEIKLINQTIEILKILVDIAEKENIPDETKIMIQTLENLAKFQNKNKKENTFLKMGGIFTTEKPFNAVEDRKKMRNGELFN